MVRPIRVVTRPRPGRRRRRTTACHSPHWHVFVPHAKAERRRLGRTPNSFDRVSAGLFRRPGSLHGATEIAVTDKGPHEQSKPQLVESRRGTTKVPGHSIGSRSSPSRDRVQSIGVDISLFMACCATCIYRRFGTFEVCPAEVGNRGMLDR